MNKLHLPDQWDLVIVGGGITGAGIFNMAAQAGIKVLLAEQKDFAWGTSSRSSKLVHGGLRYLKQGNFFLTLNCVRERQRLLDSEYGLVSRLPFFMPVYSDHGPSATMMHTALSLYSLMAMNKQHRYWPAHEAARHWPSVNATEMTAGFSFMDAQVDDARLVLNLIHQGQLAGGTALNYTRVCHIGRDRSGSVRSAVLQDTEFNDTVEVRAPVIVNATGVWADRFGTFPVKGFRLRPLRGSHLIFPSTALPVTEAVTFSHPRDSRPVFLLPWENCVLMGTTEIDHEESLAKEPSITTQEAEYLIEGVRFILPELNCPEKNCIASFAGVRPVLSKGKCSASNEGRDHFISDICGLITVTGGKLTTFRRIASQTLFMVKKYLKRDSGLLPGIQQKAKIRGCSDEIDLSPSILAVRQRLIARYGEKAAGIILMQADSCDEPFIPGTHTLWSELAWTAQNEQVRHLSDILLRRVRIGLFFPGGALSLLDRVQEVCSPWLSWDDARWKCEKLNYKNLWIQHYSSPF